MLIENSDMLITWLTANLEPLCDADPAALAKYVMALVKKDKSEEELKSICMTQLDVFLQKETKGFVVSLFDMLESRAYTSSGIKKSSKTSEPKSSTGSSHQKNLSSTTTSDISKSIPSSQKKDNVKSADHTVSERDRSMKTRRSRSTSPRVKSKSKSRSRSPPYSHRNRSAKDEQRPRNRRNDTRVVGDSYRDKEKESRNRERKRSLSKSRSKSPSPRHKEKRIEIEKSNRRDIEPKGPRSPKRDTHSSSQNNAVKPKINSRCHDYDEKGFCMRGDLCPYDHGNDPVVVEDVNLPNVLGFHPSGIPGKSSNRNQSSRPPSSSAPRVNRPNIPPPPGRPFAHNGYNPEAPGIDLSKPLISIPPPFWPGRNVMPPMPNVAENGDNKLRGNLPQPGVPQGQRTLIRIPVAQADVIKEGEESKDQLAFNNQANVIGEPNQIAPSRPIIQKKKNFNNRNNFPFNRMGKRKFNHHPNDNCILQLRKVPFELNTITQLNNHFCKFGNIVNLQVMFKNDPEGALITFSNNAEALAAYRSTEPILNNRFIKVFWHNSKENEEKEDEPAEKSAKSSIKDRLGFQNAFKEPAANTNNSAHSEKAVVYSGGNLASTVYNSSALKKSNVNTQAAMENNRKKIEEQRKETLMKTVDLRKKNQELLEKQIQQQKCLIEKIEKSKDLPAADKAAIMKTIKQLSDGIELSKKLLKNNELKKLVNTTQAKSKTEAQKEILDVELELYNKQTTGSDTSDLRRKVAELKHEAASLGLISHDKKHLQVSHNPFAKGRGGMQWSNHMHTNIDNRPKKLKVRSLDGSLMDKTEIMSHFCKIAPVEECLAEEKAYILTFKSRKDAENAAKYGVKFKDQTLILNWHKEQPPKALLRKVSNQTSVDDGEEVNPQNVTVGEETEDLLVDEEEEEDSEARSWRR